MTNYIYWQREAIYKRVSQKDWMKIFKDLKRAGGKRTNSKCIRNDFKENDYLVIKKGNYDYLYTYNEFDGYRVYTTNPIDDEKNYRDYGDRGKKAFKHLEDKFKELNDGLTLYKAFGHSPSEIKRCIPKSFYYTNDKYLGVPIRGASMADFCSQYPSSACGLLPDWTKYKICQGTVAPDSKYRFAFYINSGHVAEWSRFDSHEWLKSRYYKALFRWDDKRGDGFHDIDPKDDITILCEASDYRLDDVWSFFYENRKTPGMDKKAKLVMNASIGVMHLQNYKERKFAHLAAIIIGRANDRMLKLANKIGFNNVCHIVIDGIIYLGDKVVGVKKKALQNLYQEYVDIECIIKGTNAYIIQDHEGNILEVKHGAYDIDERGNAICVETCHGFKDIFGWKRAQGIQLEEDDYYGEESVQ